MDSMKPILLTLTLCLDITLSLCAQEREIQNVLLFSRQSQIDSFRIYYPTTSSLTNVQITGADITNLDSLIGLKSVFGNLTIQQNPLLLSLRGLDSLQWVEDHFYIHSNKELTDLHGLERLFEVGKRLSLDNNSALKDLKGLEGLRRVNKLDLNSNAVLESLDGLENLANSGWTYSLMIANCYQLSSLKALENQAKFFFLTLFQCNSLNTLDDFKRLKQLSHLRLFKNKNLQDITALHTLRNGSGFTDIDIQKNSRLKSLSGLDSLAGLDDLIIIDNDSLITLEGLNQVDSIKGPSGIKIIGNQLLRDISALSGVQQLVGALEIKDNPLLSTCNHPFVCDFVQYTSMPDVISNNLTACASVPAVITSCEFEGGQARGRVYLDMNCNLLLDSNDFAIPHYLLEDVETHKPLIATDTAGRYIRYLHLNDSLEWRPRPLPRFSAHPLSYNVEVASQPIDLDQLDFALCPDTLFHDVSVTLSPFADIRPGFFSVIHIGVGNNGTYVEQGVKLTLEFEIPPAVDTFEITSADGNAVIAGHAVSWDLPDLIPFQKLYIPVIVYVGSMTPIGTNIIASIHIESQSTETNLQNNAALVEQEVVGSIDPNDKRVNRSQIKPTDQDSTLEYIIRFQNTGNYPATFIEIIDTIDASLDVSTFDMIAASHAYVMLFPEEHVIRWRFDNILLPDSTSNEPASHGYVHFSFKPSHQIDVEKGITNSASIYFDFNAPVRTNEAKTMIEVTTSLYDEIGSDALIVWPNPVEDVINIQFDLKSSSRTTLKIYSIDGRLVYHEDLGYLSRGPQQTAVSVSAINNGVYTIRVGTVSENFTSKVILK